MTTKKQRLFIASLSLLCSFLSISHAAQKDEKSQFINTINRDDLVNTFIENIKHGNYEKVQAFLQNFKNLKLLDRASAIEAIDAALGQDGDEWGDLFMDYSIIFLLAGPNGPSVELLWKKPKNKTVSYDELKKTLPEVEKNYLATKQEDIYNTLEDLIDSPFSSRIIPLLLQSTVITNIIKETFSTKTISLLLFKAAAKKEEETIDSFFKKKEDNNFLLFKNIAEFFELALSFPLEKDSKTHSKIFTSDTEKATVLIQLLNNKNFFIRFIKSLSFFENVKTQLQETFFHAATSKNIQAQQLATTFLYDKSIAYYLTDHTLRATFTTANEEAIKNKISAELAKRQKPSLQKNRDECGSCLLMSLQPEISSEKDFEQKFIDELKSTPDDEEPTDQFKEVIDVLIPQNKRSKRRSFAKNV